MAKYLLVVTYEGRGNQENTGLQSQRPGWEAPGFMTYCLILDDFLILF
jgi:hypothetical protein